MPRRPAPDNSVQALIEKNLRSGMLQKLPEDVSQGRPMLVLAQRALESATRELPHDSDSAFVLAYDAARRACAALLQEHGLRATARGGHRTVELLMVALYGERYEEFGWMRHRRNELEYPIDTAHAATAGETQRAIDYARQLIAWADQELPA